MPELGDFPPEVTFLIEAVASAPSADNSQPWCFDWNDNTLTGRVYRRGGFPSDYHATTLALGAAAENLNWAIKLLGLDVSSWFLGPPGADGVFAQGLVTKQINIAPFPEMPIWKRRHTNRSRYRLEIGPDISQGLMSCSVGEVGVKVIQGRDIKHIADWVKHASEIRFQTREVNEWLAASLRYGNSNRDTTEGLNVNTLALPFGGVALLRLMSSWKRMEWLNRIKAYKLFAAIEAINFQKTPLVVAIIGPSDKTAVFDAGRCLQQLWLRVTEMELSAHPYYVVADLLARLDLGRVPMQCLKQAMTLRENIRTEFGQDQVLHCLLRVGRPVNEVQVSGRLPLDQIMCNAPHNG